MNQKVATDIKSVKTIKAFNKAYRKHLLRKSMPDNLKIPITTDIATLIISISINLSVTYDYTWGNSFVAVSSVITKSCQVKNPSEYLLEPNIWLWMKHPGSSSWWSTGEVDWEQDPVFFLLFQSFSWDNRFLRAWDIGGIDGIFAFGFYYAEASGCVVSDSLLIVSTKVK